MAKKTVSVKQSETKRGKTKSDFPKHSLEEALRVPKALEDANGGQSLPPTDVAIALGMSPGSSEFRTILSSAIKYGLTRGSFNQERIALEEMGRNIVEPKNPGEADAARAAAALRPETFRTIYNYFRGKKLSDPAFFQNTVVREFQIPRDHAEKCVGIFNANMERVGLIRVASTGRWLSSESAPAETDAASGQQARDEADEQPNGMAGANQEHDLRRDPHPASTNASPAQVDDKRKKRVFITHGKNLSFIEPVKKLLSFGELEAVVAAEKHTVAQPVPDKVMNEMRTCGAAIIHVEDELRLLDGKAIEHVVLNPNVLIEIGAAMALYGRRFILLVRDGINLPSNLQGLFEVRYAGESLDGTATIKLLEAINDIKNHPLPVRG
jgi:predicted nucleotide-binding protein